MKKRAGFAYAVSVGLGVVSFVLLMMKLFGPATRWIALSLYVVGWGFFVYAVRYHARALRELDRGKDQAKKLWTSWGQELVAAACLGVIGALGFVLTPPTNVAFLVIPVEAARKLVQQDSDRVQRAADGIERQREKLIAVIRASDATKLEDKPGLRDAWSSYLDYAVELDRLMEVHKHFYQLNPAELRVERADSFAVGFLALGEQVGNGLAVREAVHENPALVTLFNEASPEHGLPAQSYFALNQGLVRADGLLRLQAGVGYLAVLRSQGRFMVDGDRALAERAQRSAFEALKALGSNAGALVDNPLTFFETKAFAAWFPLQKSVANGLGNIRVQDRPYFVDQTKLEALRGKLEPMDVMLERRNWYLTNIGLPGFWPHAALYVGDVAVLDAYFDSATVNAKTGYPLFSDYLREKAPRVLEEMTKKDEHGDTMRVLEAIGEGVVFTSLEHSGNADYLAVMRPRLTREQKLEALLRAFSHHQKPYDFDFDFVTDNSIVCSELVYKSLEGIGSIHFDLAPSAGRTLLTPNQIAQKFAEEFDTENAALEFVAFLDGSEANQTAHERDASALCETWRRPKWDIAQK
jgi:hypothetical protein